MSDLLESSLAVLALISDPSVVALAGPVRAGARKAAFIAGLGRRGGFAAQHQTKRNANSQVSPPDAPFRRPARGDAHRAVHDGRAAGLCRTGGCRGSSRHPKLRGDPLQAGTGSPPVTQGNCIYALSEHAERRLFPKCGSGEKRINFDQLKRDGRCWFSGASAQIYQLPPRWWLRCKQTVAPGCPSVRGLSTPGDRSNNTNGSPDPDGRTCYTSFSHQRKRRVSSARV